MRSHKVQPSCLSKIKKCAIIYDDNDLSLANTMQVMVSLHPNWNQFIKTMSVSNFAVFSTCNMHYKKNVFVPFILVLERVCTFDL